MSIPPSTNLKIHRLLRAALSVVLALIALTLIMPRSEAEARVTQNASIQQSPTGVQYPGAAPCDTTLQTCIAAMPTGETINILPGVYTESITLNKRVSLIGAGSDQTILRASSGRVMTITGAAVDSSVVISGLMITGGRLTGQIFPTNCGGGVLLTQQAQPLFYNVIISDNVAEYGAGIYALGGPLTLTNVSVISNTSQRRGAGVYAQAAVQVTGGRFERNRATIDAGGAIYAGGALNVSNATFRSNSATQGGAIMAYGATSIGDSQFFDNAVNGGGYGGAVMVQGATTIENSWFENNRTAQLGGAVYVLGTSAIDHSSFISNSAGSAGGLLVQGTANLSDVTFTGNTAVNGNGGALHLGPSSADATIVNGVFEDNRTTAVSSSGGAIDSDANLLIMSSRVMSNSASTNGGGVDSNGPIVLIDTHVAQNQAGWYGGGVHAMSLVKAVNSQFMSNTAGRNYGGLYAYGTTTVTMSIFQNNVALDSGGLGVTGHLTMDSSRFVGNIATDGNGAGLFSNSGADVSNTTFEDNRCVKALCLGGGYYVGDVANLTGLTFVNNFAAGNGGGLATRRTITVERSVFLGNHANNGGGFYQQGSVPTDMSRVVNNLFARNTVTNAGTAVAVNTLGGVTLLYNTIGDPALNAKSAINVANGTVGVTNTIVSNHAVGINRVLGNVYQDYNVFFANTLDLAGTIGGGGYSHQGDPRFVDPAVDNYRIRGGSVALDTAIDMGVTNDLDGNPRPQGAGFDVGAYESALLDLMLTKSAPHFADLGEPLTYTLVVSNAGPAMATEVIVTDVLPANVNLISVSDNCVAGSVVTCAFGALPAGVAGSAQVVVSAAVSGTLVNTAEANAHQLGALGLPPMTVSVSTTIVAREATTTTVQPHPNPSIIEQPAVFTATVTAARGTPTGEVTFKYGGLPFGTATLNNGAASITTTALPYGDWPIVAEYGGDGAFRPSASAALTHSIILPPQDYRDIGSVRVWADHFAELDNQITAFGHVFVGSSDAGDDGKWYSVSDHVVVISDTDSIIFTLNGQLAFVEGGVPLIDGTYEADPDTGVVTLLDASTVYTQLGKSEIGITPTLSINLLEREVDAEALVLLSLPETQTINSTFTFKIGPNNAITATTSLELNIKLAGGKLQGSFSAGPEGIEIKNATLEISGTQKFSITDLVIDNKAPRRIRLSVGTEFPIPNISMLDGGFQLNGITATLGLDYNSGEGLAYNIDLKIRSMQLPTLPFNSSVLISSSQPINLKLSKGVLSGKVPNFQVTVFGQPARFSGVEFKHAIFAPPTNFAAALNTAQSDPIEYHLFAKQAEFAIPKAWQQKLITGTNLTSYFLIQDMLLTSRAPFFRVNTVGGRFAISETYYLAGDANAKAAVKFDNINGLITWTDIGRKLAMELESRVTFQLGSDWSSAGTVRLYMNDKGITAALKSFDLVLAGITVKLDRLDYTNDLFSAVTATLQLPNAWGSGKVVVNHLQIISTGVTIGGAGGGFDIPDKQLGIIALSNMHAAISVTAQREYLVQITATIAISGAQNAVSTSGSLWIHNGRVDGTISGFSFKLGGVEFTVQEPKWVDDRITAKEIGLTLPSSLGGFGTTIYGLEIGGPSGFKIAGGKFKIPDFTMGNVGVKNVLAEFVRLADGSYSIAAGAKIGFEAFAVDGGFTLQYIPPTDVRLRQVRLAFEGTVSGGTAIPIANTGAFITKVSGAFDLTSGTLEVRFGIRITGVADFLGIPLIAADGEVIVRAQPFELQTNAYTRLLGIRVNQVNVRITSRSFTLSGQTELQIARAMLSLAFGFDAENEFTAYGSAEIELGLRQGSIGCVLWACLPPWDVTLARTTFDAGKFYYSGQKVWGARGMFSLWGASFYAFAQVAPNVVLRTGLNLNDYRPVPIGLAAQNVEADGVAAAAYAYGLNVTGAATDLWIVEAITTTNRSNPQPIALTAPNGAGFTQSIVYESANKDQRIYRIVLANANQAAGQWIINAQNGNAIGVWGADPAPQVDTFTVTTPQGTLLPIEQQATPRFTFNGNESFDFTWTVSNNDPNFVVDVYVEDAQGVRHSIAHQAASAQTQQSGHVTWTPTLASGLYTLTLSVDDYKHTPIVSRLEPILISDTTPPAAPINLIATPRGDGSVRLTWDGSTAEADVAGYRVSVDGGAPQNEAGRLSQYEAFGLAPDSQHQFAVSAYDFSGNVGPAAIATAVMPSNGLVSQTPGRDETTTMVNEVSFAFATPIALTAFTLTNDQNVEIVGTLTPITLDVTVDEVANLGARFTPTIGPLQAGHYTTTVSALDAATNQSITEHWSFTVLAPVYQVYMPMVRR